MTRPDMSEEFRKEMVAKLDAYIAKIEATPFYPDRIDERFRAPQRDLSHIEQPV